MVITIGTTTELVGCSTCGVHAEAHDRMPIAIRGLACFERPSEAGVVQAPVALCGARLRDQDWTEQSPHVDTQVVLTRRAGAEAC